MEERNHDREKKPVNSKASVHTNLMNAMSTNNAILSVVVFAVVLGLCMAVMGEGATPLKSVIENLNEVVQMFLNFLINKTAPIAIFCLTRVHVSMSLAVGGDYELCSCYDLSSRNGSYHAERYRRRCYKCNSLQERKRA